MAKSAQGTGNERPVSKYAQKVVERKAGTRTFEFQEKHQSVNDSTIQTESRVWYESEQFRQKVKAVVIHVHVSGKFVLLKSEEVPDIYLSRKVLERTHSGTEIQKGFLVECDIGPPVYGTTKPRVINILSVTPP